MGASFGYATALFDLSKSAKDIEAYHEASRLIVEVLSSNPEIKKVMQSSTVTTEQKKEIIEKTFSGALPKNIENALYLMIDLKSFNVALESFKELNKMYNKEFNIEQGIIFTTEKITGPEVKKIEKIMCDKLGKKVSLTAQIDKELIGGIKVTIGDNVFDYSTKNSLNQIKANLLEGVK